MKASMDKIVNLCKSRGFIFPGSEIYGGLANSWDYGPLGVQMKNNIKDAISFRDYLIDNAQTLSLGRDFYSQQANIFALEISSKYPENPNIKENYRLNEAEKLAHML